MGNAVMSLFVSKNASRVIPRRLFETFYFSGSNLWPQGMSIYRQIQIWSVSCMPSEQKSSNCDILLIELKIRIKLIPPYSRMSAIEKKKKNTKKKKEKMTALFRK